MPGKKFFSACTLSILTLFLLTGCDDQPLTYSYLMQHPKKLEREATHCQSQNATTGDCRLVLSAANDFAVLLSEQQQNPEQFGQKILLAQMACKEAQDSIDKACENVKVWLAVVGVNSPE